MLKIPAMFRPLTPRELVERQLKHAMKSLLEARHDRELTFALEKMLEARVKRLTEEVSVIRRLEKET